MERSAGETTLVIPAGGAWSDIVSVGERLCIVDLQGAQAVDALFYNARDMSERYDANLTVLSQESPTITVGSELLSCRGRPLLKVVADTFGCHDTLVGCCSAESNAIRFGEATRHMHACRENFVAELARWGLTKRDIVANLNLFMRVTLREDGEIAIVEDEGAPGHFVELEAQMDILCVLSNCPQINNPANGFDPTPIEVTIRASKGS
jgi:hypothetical protein